MEDAIAQGKRAPGGTSEAACSVDPALAQIRAEIQLVALISAIKGFAVTKPEMKVGELEAMLKTILWFARSALEEDQPNAPAQRPEGYADAPCSDSDRLDWLMRNVSGIELRRMGIVHSAGCTRADVDCAMSPNATEHRTPGAETTEED